MSSFVGPSDDLTPSKLPAANLAIPIFWGHGQADAVVPFGFGKVGADQLKQVCSQALVWSACATNISHFTGWVCIRCTLASQRV